MLLAGEILYFLHIPKTGGTSLLKWLSLHYAPDRICPHLELEPIRDDLEQDPRRYDFYAGHHGLELLTLLPKKPCLITWLRDPTPRLLSSYNYLRGLPEDTARQLLLNPHAQKQRELALRLNFDAWVALPNGENEIHNIQAHFLAGQKCSKSELLPRALLTLSRADHFGLTERMQDSVDLLCHRFVLPPRRFDVHLNRSRSPRATTLSAETADAIRRLEHIDFQLCDAARQIFDQRWRAMLADLELDPDNGNHRLVPDGGSGDEAFRGLIHARLEERFRRLRIGATPCETGRIDLNARVLGAGWMPAIKLPESGLNARWSGPEAVSVLYLNLPRERALQFSFTMLSVMDYEVIRSFEFRLNGEVVPLVCEPAPQRKFPYAHCFSGVITPAVLAREPGLAKLEFCISRTVPEPVASEPELGPKLLGFLTDAIALQPV